MVITRHHSTPSGMFAHRFREGPLALATPIYGKSPKLQASEAVVGVPELL